MNTLSPHSPRFDSLPRLTYVNALFIIGTLGTLITPAMLEGWTHLRWTPTQLGGVAAIELAGLAAGSLSGLYWQTRWRWRRVALASLIVGIAANAACMVVKDFAFVCVLRALVGVSGGLLSALYSAVLANSRSPGRIIAVILHHLGVRASGQFGPVHLDGRVVCGAASLLVLVANGVAQRVGRCAADARDARIATRLPLALVLHPFHCGADGGLYLSR